VSGSLDRRRQHQIRGDGEQHGYAAHRVGDPVRDVGTGKDDARDERRQRGGERAERMPGVEHEVVQGKRPRSSLVRYGGRQDRLFERGCGTPVAAHPIQHAGETRAAEAPRPR
jgi:hypothetical protein